MSEVPRSARPGCRLTRYPKYLATVFLAALVVTGCKRHDSVEKQTAADAPALDYGTKIGFGQSGGSEPFRESGWSKTEEKFTWTEGAEASLRMRVPATDAPVTLRMKLNALVREPVVPFQMLEVRVNDKKVAEWQVSNVAEFAAALPTNITKAGGDLTITFKTPTATSPKSLGLNEDARVLGVCCWEIELSKG